MPDVQISNGAAESLANACSRFSEAVSKSDSLLAPTRRTLGKGIFRSSAEIGDVYGTCASSSLPTLFEDFKSQSDAMSVLFKIAGGTLSAQDDEAATALKNAASAPPSINGPSMAIAGLSSISAFDAEASRTDKFSWVSGEDASGMSLDEMKSGAESLSPGELRTTSEQFTTAARTLSTAADQLLADVQRELGSSWQGQFATTAQANVAMFHRSATELAGQLTTVAERANSLAEGYEFTRQRVGGITPDSGAELESDTAASLEAARKDAQRVIHSDYNPRLESANLSGLNFTPAHRVGNAGGTGIDDVSPVSLWNREVVAPEGGVGGMSRSAVDAPTSAASSSAGASGASGPAGGGAPNSGGSPAAGAASAPGNGTSGVIPAGVGPAAGGGARSANGATPTPGRSGASGTTPAAAGATRPGSGQAGSSPGVRAASGPSPSAPLGGRSTAGMAGTAGPGGGGAAGSRPLGSSASGGSSPRSGMPFAAGAITPGGAGSAGGTPRAGTGPGMSTGPAAVSGSPSVSPGSAGHGTSSRVGGPMMGAMPMGAGTRGGDKGHTPADYLVHPSHSSELIGDLPAAVQPVLRGRRTPAE